MEALVRIGPPAVRLLCEALRNDVESIRTGAALVLRRIGDDETLPRRVLADTRMTGRQRYEALRAIRLVGYQEAPKAVIYSLLDIRRYCEPYLEDDDAALREGAKAVLEFCSSQTLLRPGHRDAASERDELLHSTSSPETGISAKEHLRPADAPDEIRPHKGE